MAKRKADREARRENPGNRDDDLLARAESIKSNNDGESDVDENDGEELIFMSILYDRKQLGVAIYDALTTSLKTLQIDVHEVEELEQAERLWKGYTLSFKSTRFWFRRGMPVR
ncbi:hypothetical protein FI667_g2670, partial [Globisporangium splendens]